MTTGESPTVVRLDPDAGATADFWNRLLAGAPRPEAMLLLADPSAREGGWAPRAALALADGMAERHGSALLIDLQLERPQLHRVASIRNEEGIVDVLLFGASTEHVARRVAGSAARVVPVGPFVPEPRDVIEHTGWARLIDDATADGGVVLVYAPLETELGSLTDRFTQVVLLRGAASADAPVPDLAVIGIIAPPIAPAAAAAAPTPTGPAPSGEPDAEAPVSPQPPAVGPSLGAEAGTVAPAPAAEQEHAGPGIQAGSEREALVADLRSRQQSALLASSRPAGEPRRPVVMSEPPPRPASAAVAAPVDGEPDDAAAPGRRRSRLPAILVTVFLLLLLAGLAGTWHYFGREYFAAGGAQPAATPTPPPVDDGARATGEPLPYSVAIEAYPDLRTAADRVDALEAAEAGMGFYIAPLLLDSVLYYRVMAGPVRDSTTAVAILDSLLAKGHKTGSSEYDLRNTPLAFLLGELPTREEAEERMRELRRLDIPSYVVEVPYTSGPPRFRLYSGAYAGPAEADVMRQFLQNVGLADTLVLRTGQPQS